MFDVGNFLSLRAAKDTIPIGKSATFRFFWKVSFAFSCWIHQKILKFFASNTKDYTLSVKGYERADALFLTEGQTLAKQSSAPEVIRGRSDRWLIYPESHEVLPMPRSIESGDPAQFNVFLNVCHLPTYVYRFDEVVYLRQNGSILNEHNCIYEDLLDGDPQTFLRKNSWRKFASAKDNSYVLSANRNHYHWLIKMLTRIHLLEKVDLSFSDFDSLLISHDIKTHWECYDLLGIPREKLHIVPPKTFLFCKNLYTATIPENNPPWATDFLMERFASILKPVPNPKRAVYFARDSSANIKRRVINHEEVVAYLESIGVLCVELRKQSFTEQVSLAANADLIIAPHGAALTNLAFAREGTRVLEIFSNEKNNKCFWRLAQRKKLIYHYMMGEQIPCGEQPNHYDLTIPLEKLKRAIDFLMRDNG